MPASKAYTVPTIFTAVDRFTKVVNAMGMASNAFVQKSQAGLAVAERAWGKLMAPVRSLNKMMMGLGYYVGLYSLFRVLGGMVKVFADWEQSQINIQSLSQGSVRDNRVLGLEARKVAVSYGQAAHEVSNLQYELLKMGFTAGQVKQMTEPIAAGAKALRTTPERLSEVAAGILLSYNKDAGQTKDVINKLAYAANLTAADFESYATQLPIVNRVAFLSGQSYEKVLAYLGTLRNVQIHTATGATSLKNIIIDAAKNGMDFRKAIEKVAHANNAVVYAAKKFGKRSVVSAVEFSKQLDYIDALVKKIQAAPSDYVNELAKKQLSGLNGILALTKSSYEEFILSVDEGTGPYGRMIKDTFQTVRAMLLFAAGTDAATSAMNDIDLSTLKTGRKFLGWLSILGRVLLVIAAIRLAMFAWKTLTFAFLAVQALWNIALGVSVALGWKNAWAIRGNVVAMYAARAATLVVTAATWLWTGAQAALNLALIANPIGAVILAIAALVGYITIVVTKWNEWGAALSLTSGPLGLMLSMLQAFRRNWDMIVKAFTDGGILEGLKAIGKTILDAMIMPVQQFYGLLAKLPESMGGSFFAKMEQDAALLRKSLGVNTDTDENGQPFRKDSVRREEFSEEDRKALNQIINNRIKFDFAGVPLGTRVESSDSSLLGAITPRLGSTMGF